MSSRDDLRRFAIFAVGWLTSATLIWSVSVYDLHTLVAVLLAALPWLLAIALLRVADSAPPKIPLDLSPIAVRGGLRAREYAAGDLVVRQGDVAEYFYIITKGRARVLVDDDYGSQTEVGELLEGHFFGEIGLLTGATRNATVQAVDALAVLVMDQDSFSNLISHAGAAADHIRIVAKQRTRS